MARRPASVAASAVRIEDEVWDEAFSARVPSRRRRASTARPARPITGRPTGTAPTLRIAEPPPVPAVPPPGTRRTVRIQGRGADPYRSSPSGAHAGLAPARTPAARSMGSSPDRLAMWAALLGFLLVVVAILSSHF